MMKLGGGKSLDFLPESAIAIAAAQPLLLKEKIVGTPDPHHKLHEYMDRDDVGWPSPSRFGWGTKPIWAYFIVILFM